MLNMYISSCIWINYLLFKKNNSAPCIFKRRRRHKIYVFDCHNCTSYKFISELFFLKSDAKFTLTCGTGLLFDVFDLLECCAASVDSFISMFWGGGEACCPKITTDFSQYPKRHTNSTTLRRKLEISYPSCFFSIFIKNSKILTKCFTLAHCY